MKTLRWSKDYPYASRWFRKMQTTQDLTDDT